MALLLTYLRYLAKPVGLLINFNNSRLVDGLGRLINTSVFPSVSSGETRGELFSVFGFLLFSLTPLTPRNLQVFLA